MRLIASCLCLLCSLSALGAENLMRNPGFEEETRDGGAPEAWGIGKGGQFPGKLTWVADAARAHSGSAFIELASFDEQRSVTLYSGTHQKRFNEPLRFSIWCRGNGEVRLGVAAYYTTLKQGVIQWGEWAKATPDWQKLAFDFQAQNPADVKGERLTPMHFAPLLLVKGKVALDDAVLASPSVEAAPAVFDPAAPTPLMTIPFTSEPPTMDGKLDDPAWRRAAAVTGFVQLDGQLSPRQTAVFATHDSERLYLAYRASFADVLREGRREHDLDFNHETDYCEFLVQPPGQNVFHAVFSPAGGILDL
ncbi:MAG: hypothetical protein FJ279_18295, partial [Planctomycetes bacterium]|nr:hypothetical protein [Planctomycetota bacterium]